MNGVGTDGMNRVSLYLVNFVERVYPPMDWREVFVDLKVGFSFPPHELKNH